MGCDGTVVVGSGIVVIGRILGCDELVVVGGLGVVIPVCGGIVGGTLGIDVVGNVSNGVGALTFLTSSSSNSLCTLLNIGILSCVVANCRPLK